MHRAYNICSDYISLTPEKATIIQLQQQFPNYLVDQVTKEFINKKQNNKFPRSKQKRHGEHRATKQPSWILLPEPNDQ